MCYSDDLFQLLFNPIMLFNVTKSSDFEIYVLDFFFFMCVPLEGNNSFDAPKPHKFVRTEPNCLQQVHPLKGIFIVLTYIWKKNPQSRMFNQIFTVILKRLLKKTQGFCYSLHLHYNITSEI